MRARRALVLVTLAVMVTGCATTGTQAGTSGSITTRCKEVDLANVSVEPTPVTSWDPKPLAPGFLHIHYSWDGASNGPVYAVGILYENLETQRVAFIVGPLAAFPQGWSTEGGKGDAPAAAKSDWVAFFTKLRAAGQFTRPGGVFCAGQGCGVPPDSPPPELLGTGSSGSAGGFSALPQVRDQRYAQVMRSREVVSDGVFGATSNRADRERAIKDLVRNTCHGVQALLGNE